MATPRLLIGADTIIDLEPSGTQISGSAPANADVRLYQHPDDRDYFRWTFDSDNNAELACRITIEGTGGSADAAAKTAYENLVPVLRAIKNNSVRFESPSGNQRYQLPLQFVEQQRAVADVVQTQRGYRIDLRLITEGVPEEDGAPDGAVGPLKWTVHFQPGGRALVIGEVTFSSRAKLNEWIDDLRAGTHPDWMGGHFRFQRHEPQFEQKEAGYTGAQLFPVTVEMLQMISALENTAALSDLVDYRFTSQLATSSRSSRGQDRRRERKKPGHMITITGFLQHKTEKLTEFNANDSVQTAPADVFSVSNRAIDAIVRHVDDVTPWRLKETERNGEIDSESGVYNFTVRLEMPDNNSEEIFYLERMRFTYSVDAPKGVRSDGTTKRWYSAEGMQVQLHHTVTIRSFERPRWRFPIATSARWAPVGGEFNEPEVEAEVLENGELIYELHGESHWDRDVNKSGNVLAPPRMDHSTPSFGLVD